MRLILIESYVTTTLLLLQTFYNWDRKSSFGDGLLGEA
jgi:hypothetical protein